MAKVFTITEGLENMGAMKTGGQGSVYKGRRIGEIITAIKLLPTPIHSETADDKNFTAFQNEVQKLKKVNEIPNPYVVKILSSGITDSGNFPFIEMEYIEGPDLEELLKPPHEPLFTVKEVLKVADQLSNALSHCHNVGVKHGDIKSNNIKHSVNTGNYILLDFGLAVMSDEQRRSSLRHAGAIEFMAPEQNEGLMLFQTDVYSFGVVLFELLAGTVPFPLKDKGETARNAIVVAHIETPPPDLVYLRKSSLPAGWDEQKKEYEMHVPEWLVSMVYKCLEKKPEDRFANGAELHEYISQNRIRTVNSVQLNNDRILFLEEENQRLRKERAQLQQQLLKIQPGTTVKNPALTTNAANDLPVQPVVQKKRVKSKVVFLGLFILIAIAGIVYFLINAGKTSKVIGEYNVVASRAYFYNEADDNTRRNAYAVQGKSTINAFDEKNGFIYTEITNDAGQTSKGWLRKKDLVNAGNVAKKISPPVATVSPVVSAQLQTARQFLMADKLIESLIIYSTLSKQNIPEAMFQYGRLALQNKNSNITCGEAFDLVKRAADKGYTPAKRTLGFLYTFAEDTQTLQQRGYYERCTFTKNTREGTKLLMEAMLSGDTTAANIID
ncbi:MAG TPA: serine/threonine-protein kinase, partial [Segetibacter sp.]